MSPRTPPDGFPARRPRPDTVCAGYDPERAAPDHGGREEGAEGQSRWPRLPRLGGLWNWEVGGRLIADLGLSGLSVRCAGPRCGL